MSAVRFIRSLNYGRSSAIVNSCYRKSSQGFSQIHSHRLRCHRTLFLSHRQITCRLTKSLNPASQRLLSTLAMGEVNIKDFIFPNDQPVVSLECRVAFEALTNKEKLYAHHLSRASYYGGLVVLVQTSPESPLIFSLLHQVFQHNTVQELKDIAMQQAGLSEDEFNAVLVYTSGLYTNMGNYKGFGDSKFVPNVSAEKLEALLKASAAFAKNSSFTEVWERVKGPMYDLTRRRQQLGLGEKGVTTYFSDNCTMEDAEVVNRYMKSIHTEAYNNRLLKTVQDGVNHYEIRYASVEEGPLDGLTRDWEEFEGHKFCIARGDYSPLLRLVVDELNKAKEFASNDTEVQMLDEYIKSFTTGSLDAHKDGSRHWIKNKGPIIETYIGFIETYRDPAGIRGEFEGFVAMVNKEMSAKFGQLVSSAETFISLLPWPTLLEKDVFLKPDFTSLDVLSFAGSGIPAGINIPNYDEIRQSEGFKNVSLGNVIPASYKDPVVPFLSKEDQDLLNKYRVEAFEVQVGLHELLGHGSGKLLRQESDGSFNFEKDFVQTVLQPGEELTWYNPGETYDSKFTTMSSSYEECRAESVGLYLSLNKDVLKIFGFEGQTADDVVYVNWLNLLWGSVAKALEMYQPQTKAWLQAHSQARFVILQVLLEAGSGLVDVKKVTGADGKDDLLLTLDRSKIDTVGKEAIGNFLRKLQVYKSTGNVEAAKAMYDKYSEVKETGTHPFGLWRSIVMDRKQPRKMFVQANTVPQGAESNVELVDYEATPAGLIQSWKDRFNKEEKLYSILDDLWHKDKPYF